MRKHLLTVFLLLGLLTACAGEGDLAPTPAATTSNPVIATESKLLDTSGEIAMPNVGQAAPEFEYTLANGTTRKLSDLRGKKVIVNFWATWCEPCREEMPDLDKIQHEYGDDLVVIAVNKAEKLPRIEGFTGEVPVSFALVANPSGDISQRYGTRTLPNSYFINTDGTIGARELKVMDYDTIKQNIDALR